MGPDFGSESSYKEQKERFVSGLTGGSVWEINAVTAVMPAAVFVWSVLQARFDLFRRDTVSSLLVDFLINVCALLAATTLYSDHQILLLSLLLAPTAILLLINQKRAASRRSKEKASAQPVSRPDEDFDQFPNRPFLTAYRGSMLVSTNLCILAVDFPVFPRRFAKVETWGTSLMDLGVGSFVFSAGLVAAKPVLKARMVLPRQLVTNDKQPGSATRVDKDGGAGKRTSLLARATGAFRNALPLLILGLIRLCSVKGLDYAEHVTEYGVHWNFFFTMGLLPIGLALMEDLLALTPAILPGHAIIGLLLTAVQGLLLDPRVSGLQKWALTASRTNLLSANREGIVSFVGYLSIFLLGMEAGTVVLPRTPIFGLGKLAGIARARNSSPRAHRRKTLLVLGGCSFVFAGMSYALVGQLPGLGGFSQPISRRLANTSYVLWISAFNYLQVAVCCLIETFLFPGAHAAKYPEEERRDAKRGTSTVLDAYNGSGLAIFLLGNLGTGLVNLSTDTLSKGPKSAVGILLVYMGLLTMIAVMLKRKGWKIKL